MAKAPTQREMFARIANFLDAAEAPEDMVEFVEGRIAALNKRANAPKAPTKDQLANEMLKNEIVTVLTAEGATATDIGRAVGKGVQKAAAMLTQLVAEGRALREQDGKTVLFKAV